MPPEKKKRPPTLAIEPEIYGIFTALYEKSNSKSLMKFGNEIIQDYIEKQAFLRRYAPHLSVHKIEKNSISLIDEHIGKIVKVELRDCRFWCSEDRPKSCMHIFYVIGHPKVGQLEDPEP